METDLGDFFKLTTSEFDKKDKNTFQEELQKIINGKPSSNIN